MDFLFSGNVFAPWGRLSIFPKWHLSVGQPLECREYAELLLFLHEIYYNVQLKIEMTNDPSTKRFKRTLVTTALPYANGPVHIGHLAGVYVPADIYVRYKRMRGEEVLFIGGSDEHGVPISLKAKAEGITPQQAVS